MLKVIKGNLWDLIPSGAVVAHGCNAQGVMSSGFAKQIKDMFPDAYEEYLNLFPYNPHNRPRGIGEYYDDYNGKSMLSKWVVVQCPGNIYIANVITQQYYGRDPNVKYVSYQAVVEGLSSLAKYANENRLPIYMPFIGGGLANGNRDVLMALFEEIFEETEAYLVIND